MDKKIIKLQEEAKKFKGVRYRNNAFAYRVYYSENKKQKIFFMEDGFKRASHAYLRKEKIEEIKKISQKKGFSLTLIQEKLKNGIDLDKLIYELKTNLEILKETTLIEVFDTWFNIYVEQKPITQKTKDKRWQNHKRIHDYWKDTKIKDIKIADYQNFINHLGKQLELGTLQRLNSAIKQSINTVAIPNNYLTSQNDFTIGVQINSIKEKNKKIEDKFLEFNDYKKTLIELKQRMNPENSTTEYILYAIFKLGLRPGEALAICWEDFNEQEQTLYTYRRFDPRNNIFIEAKGQSEKEKKAARRKIPVDKETITIFKNLNFEQKKLFKKYNIENKNKLLFFHHINGIVSYENLFKVLKTILKKIGCKRNISAYGGRHTWANIQLMNGISIYVLAKWMGHINISQITKTYQHTLEVQVSDEIEKYLTFMNTIDQ